MVEPNCIAVDLGASTVRVGFAGEVRPMYSREVRDESVNLIVESIVEGVRRAQSTINPAPDHIVAVGCPGIVSGGRVEQALYLPLTGVNLEQALTEQLACRVIVVNDVDAQAMGDPGFALGQSYFVISAGSSVGGAIVQRGALAVGRHGSIAEIGHIPVGDPNRVCRCGGRGCLDLNIGGASLEAASGPSWWCHNDAERILEDAGAALGRAVRTVSLLYDLDYVVVLGHLAGEISLWNGFVQESSGLGGEIAIAASRVTWPHAAHGLRRIAISSSGTHGADAL